jgi:ketosteroid isomerase-like protein
VSSVIEELRRAAAAFNKGDTAPLVALLHEDVEWRGRTRGMLWWKHTPS